MSLDKFDWVLSKKIQTNFSRIHPFLPFTERYEKDGTKSLKPHQILLLVALPVTAAQNCVSVLCSGFSMAGENILEQSIITF